MLSKRKITLVLLAATGLACTDPSEPSTLSAAFDLIDVDGQPVPATSAPGAGTSAVTVVSGTMTLDRLGVAIITEDRAQQTGSVTVRYNYLYRVNNANIEFSEAVPCPTNTICTTPPSGEIVDNTIRVRLVFQTPSPFQVYNYRSVSRF